jgi:predicted RNA-binding Zn-ribbon protein involved in translation (DUF1610 family)
LALELLARAALTNIHPSLNADPQQETNIFYGFGYEIAGQPRSLPVHSVYARLERLVDGFDKPHRELCDFMGLLRNQELHTSDVPFEDLKISKWLPRYYQVVQILCGSLKKDLSDLLGLKVASQAEKLIATLNKDKETAVKSKIAAHAKVFAEKKAEEQEKLGKEAAAATKLLRHGATRQKCPACGSTGALKGELLKSLKPEFEEESAHLFMEEVFTADSFLCPACGLSLANLEEIHWAGIEPTFSQTRSTDLHELFQREYYDDYMNM